MRGRGDRERGEEGSALVELTWLGVLLLIPLVGPIAGTILTSVAATLVMFKLSDLHNEDEGTVTLGSQEA